MKKTAVFKNSPILAKNEKKWKTEKEEKLGKEKKKQQLPKKKSNIHDQIDRIQTNWTSHAATSPAKHLRSLRLQTCTYISSYMGMYVLYV